MKTYQVEIKETLCLTVEIHAENAHQAEEMVRQAYNNQDYILNAEHFTGVEFTSREKEMNEQCWKQKRHEHER
ncbi:MAG: DpnD/PcfM family protein [Lutispora sp.]|nr:DpnD/PcfM family protein [Lutispora sp.]